MNQRKIDDFFKIKNYKIDETKLDGWNYVKLSDYSQIIMGQSPPSGTYNIIKEGLVFYQGKADFGDIYPSPRVYCTEPTRIANPNDVLISIRAPVGPVNIANKKCGIGRGLAALRTSKIDFRFLFYWLKYIEHKWAKMGGTTFNAIKKSDLYSLDIHLPFTQGYPNLELQRKIVQKIEYLFNKIELYWSSKKKIEEKIIELPKAVLNKIFLSSEENNLVNINLVNVAELIMGQSPPSETYNLNQEGLSFYQGKADFSTIYPSPRVYCTNPSRTANPNDILLSIRAPCGPVNIANEKCGVGRGLAIIRSFEINPLYFYFWFKFYEDRWLLSGGTTFSNIKKEDLEKHNILVPFNNDSFDRNKISKIVNNMQKIYKKQNELFLKYNKLKLLINDLRQSILHKAFNGKLIDEN